MNRNVVVAINTAVSSVDFFAYSVAMPKIIYHGLRFGK
jgi:hypothetical protein